VLINIFELKRIDEWLQAIGHLRRGIWVDDQNGTHFAVSRVATVTIFAHWDSVLVKSIFERSCCPATKIEAVARDGDAGSGAAAGTRDHFAK